jgi:hypothetical protein
VKLTPNFTIEELTHSDTAVRLGIDNTPPANVLPHLVVLAQGLEEVRLILARPLNIHSGYRCEALERLLCAKDFAAWCARHGKPGPGAPIQDVEVSWAEYFKRKTHPLGYAADFTCAAFGTPLQIVRTLKGSGLKFDQLIQEGTWAHASFDPRLRSQVLTATFAADGTPSYTQGVA